MSMVLDDPGAGGNPTPPYFDVLGLKVQPHAPEDLNGAIGGIGEHYLIGNPLFLARVLGQRLGWSAPGIGP